MLTQQELVSAVLDGALSSAKTYLDWSKDLTIHESGIESFVSIEIGRRLIKVASKKREQNYVWFEPSFESVFEECGAPNRGRPFKEIQGSPRIDVAYFDRRERLRGVIEVKRGFRFSELRHDALRISALLKTCGGGKGTLRFGCCVGLREVNSQTRTNAQAAVDQIYQKASSTPKLKGLKIRQYHKSFRLKTPMKYQTQQGTEHEVLGFYAACLWFSIPRAG